MKAKCLDFFFVLVFFFLDNVWSKAIVLNANREGNYIPYTLPCIVVRQTAGCGTQPEPPLWRHMPSSLRSVLFLVPTKILCSKDFNFFCLLQATAGGMSGAFFSSDEARSHGFGKKDGGNRGVGYAERAVLWQEVLGDGTEFRFKADKSAVSSSL